MQKQRLLPLAGIVFVALFLVAMVLNNSSPDGDASGAKLFAYYDDHSGREMAAAFLLAVSTPFLVIFGAALATTRGPDEPRSPWDFVLLAGTTIAAGALQILAFVHFALADAPGQGLSRDAIRVLAMLDGHILATTGLGVMMLGAAGTLLSRSGGLRRLAWPALVFGIALFVPGPDFPAFLLSGIWIIVVGIVLARPTTAAGGRRAAVGATAVVCVAAALATAAAAGSGPVYQPPQSYYLALGDSITYGIQPTKVKPGATPADFDTGYVDVFAARLRKLAPKIKVVNYGCPGESTVTFTRGGCPAFADGVKLHDAFRGAQLDAALSFLRAHAGQVSPITLTLYGNDWFPVLLDRCKGKVACARKQAPSAVASFGTRLTSILQRLRAAAPTAEIIVTGAWNPDPEQLDQLRPVYRSFDTAIARAAAASRARLAKTLLVFNPPGTVRAQKARLCAYSFICSKGDPHPTNAGYRAIAEAVMAASGYPRKP